MKMLSLLSRVVLWPLGQLMLFMEAFWDSKWILYVIKKGRHRSRLRFKPVWIEGAMSFTCRFDSSAIYTLESKEDQWDINKLYGFSESIFSDHISSARVGWNYRDGVLRLYPYTYAEGKTMIDPPGVEMPLNEDIECLIIVQENRYIFYLGATRIEMPRTRRRSTKFTAVQLYPYFGGNQVAPQDIRVWVKP